MCISWTNYYYRMFFGLIMLMEMEPNLVLNQTSSKFFVKMNKTKGFRIPKYWS
jgi:hypothetical protein